MPSPNPPKLAVVGSLNIDYFTRVAAFPQPGETVVGSDLEIRFGGKGANQAVAAARLGATVSMIGCVGDDEMGMRYRERLGGFGIGCGGLRTIAAVKTGSAFINVDPSGENTIVVAAGANAAVGEKLVAENAAAIGGADVLLLQNEVPHAANAEASRIAAEAGTLVVYNPAPWDARRDLGELAVDWMIVNEVEARQLPAGRYPRVVVTRGAAPTLAEIDGERFEVPAREVEAVDTVGAGDTFVAALAVRLAEGAAAREAVGFANRAAALATLKTGAQEAMPTREQVLSAS